MADTNKAGANASTKTNNAGTTTAANAAEKNTDAISTTPKDDRASVKLQAVAPVLQKGLSNLKKESNSASRTNEKLIINDGGNKESIRLGNNKISMAPSPTTNFKVENTRINSQTMQENHTTNTFTLNTDEIVVNGHKLNPNLWEYSDFKNFKDMYMGTHTLGNLCIFGTVLTPAFDYQLKKYVLIRRLTRMPLFAPKQNVQEILPELNIEDPSKVANQYGVKQHTISADDWYNKYGKAIEEEKKNKKGKTDSGDETNNDKDGDAKEVARNGKHYFENDIKYLMDSNKGMTREQAINILKDDNKYKKKDGSSNNANGNSPANANNKNTNNKT